MHDEYDDARDAAKVFEVRLPEYPAQLQERLFRALFKDKCSKCTLPSYVEIESPPKLDLFNLKPDVGRACGFWLARTEIAIRLCAEFEGQFELKRISDDACFLLMRNILIPNDPFYVDGGDVDLTFFKHREQVCSLCGRPYILLYKGFRNFKGSNRLKPKTIYETSLRFGTGDVKYPRNFCDKEAAYALKAISRNFKFVRSTVKFSVDAL